VKQLDTITILGQTPAKKNSRQGVVRAGRIMNFPSKIYQAWEVEALWQLKGKPTFTSSKVRVNYFFYCGDHRRRDLDNMIASVNDALVKAGIIDDDDWKHLSIGTAMGMYDKENPRAEIKIEKIGEAK
jgi:Holliday junction resolvase RusA-like endonuclease